MKIIKSFLVIILAFFITSTLGFTSAINTEDKIYGNTIHQTQTFQEGSVDFMSGNDYLSVFPDIAHPGDEVYFKLRVYNNTPDNGYCGGSTVRFIMNGRIIDEVPFLLNSGEEFKDVSARLYLPEGEYSSLPEGQQVTAQVQAIIDPYDKTPESNEDNNSATFQFIVKGVHQEILEGTNPGITVDVSGLSVWSVKNDVPNNTISAALPGQKLNLKARLRFTGDATRDDINIKFIINGIVIKDFKKQIGNRPSSGYIDLSAGYYVPINATEPFDFTVILDNGSQARITIPLIRWDVGISPGNMYWTGETVAVPGKNINLKAVIQNVSFLKFPFDFNKIAYRVLIDGEVFFEDDLFISNDSNYTYIPSYKVPVSQTTPLQFTIILDPYGQLDESNEANNTATITIPIQNTGSTGPDFSISAGNLSYISRPILPGSQIKLSAAILNNSKSLLSKDLRVHFKVNGNIISNFTVSKGSFGPLKYFLVSKNWTVPANLPAGSKFEVVLDPADPDRDFPGESASDNTASVILDTYGPDLEVTADCLSWSPKEPQAGGSVTLYAGIKNTGLSPTLNDCKANFFIDENMIGQSGVPSIQGVSGFVASCSWDIPEAPELAPLEWNILKGEPGKLPLPSGTTKDYKFKVQVDSGNQITETNENNNIAEKNLTAYVPYNKAVIYVRAYDVIGNISGAQVTLETSNGKTATTYSADNGWCTFTGVPYGNYTITISADKYIVKSVTSEVKSTSLVHYREVELIRGKQFPYFTATASPLEGVTAFKVDFTCEILDPRITDSDFYFQWRDRANLLSESKSFSHTFIEPGTHEVTFSIITSSYDNIVASKSFNITVHPLEITFSDEGRILNSNVNIFLDQDLISQDPDKDGINQAWENAAMEAANPKIELDEGEDMLTTSGHKVVNFVRISPFTSNTNKKYILFTYGITWTKDYGRYTQYTGDLLLGHNGDIEKVVLAWEVINEKTLMLRYVFTSAHSNTWTSHSGVWDPWKETTIYGKIALWPVDDEMKANLEFVYINPTQSVLKVYASEDKHGIYPTKDCGEAYLTYVPAGILTGLLVPVGFFVMEDVGGGPIIQPTCYNIGEEGDDAHIIDDISEIFPNERVWSGNIDNPSAFAGGLDVDDGINLIGGNLSGLPRMLEDALNGNMPSESY